MSQDLMMEQQSSSNNKEQTQFLKTVDEVLKKLLDRGKLFESVNYISQGIKLRIDTYGEEAVEFEESDPEKAIQIFQSIESLIQSKFSQMSSKFGSIRVDLFNHMACCYRKQGKLKNTFKYLKKALDCSYQATEKAQTFLNICSVQSQMGQHKVAIENAYQALNLVQEKLVQYNLQISQADKAQKSQMNEEQQKLISILAVSYHNIGVEYEHMKSFGQCLENYKKAVTIIESYAPNLPIAESLRNTYESAKLTIQVNTKKQSIKQQPKSSSRLRPKSAKAYIKTPNIEMNFNANPLQAQTLNFVKKDQINSRIFPHSKETEALQNNEDIFIQKT